MTGATVGAHGAEHGVVQNNIHGVPHGPHGITNHSHDLLRRATQAVMSSSLGPLVSPFPFFVLPLYFAIPLIPRPCYNGTRESQIHPLL
ncbi:uncharacterized protein SPSK_10122 [Sporothrix schenckii 1099-18]|uniref:Uncharacterized protein n=1 Tax=Sporothrix schenckii 1099-18 TaxID=1397361 RepID=A0A0F2M4L8_SPOSC|nr:uncharacterized protein SPSK_10122 [Sporothrix schenckii 1099-18]KJR84562.1 hypothetical protein SPSK_10122 [Sporothrix schenckii 1099-18]